MLYVVATPIGNRQDITLRALKILEEVDFVLAEDTRKTGSLLKHFSIKKKLVSFYEHNEDKKIPQIIKELEKEKKVALVSNAGTPLVCDPGFKLVRECWRKNIKVISLPGPSSLVAALSVSPIAVDKFIFLGYLPRKKGVRFRLFRQMLNWPMACVFFESPYRVLRTLEELKTVFGDRQVLVCREMTKKFEEIFQGNLSESINCFSRKKPRGEFTLLLSGACENS